jgi:hypothetical protein
VKYPAINISVTDWKDKGDILEMFVLFDELNYNKDVISFKKYFLNQNYCDSNGEILQIVGRTLPTNPLRKIFSFLPNVFKCVYIIEPTGKKMSLIELKQFLLSRIEELEHDAFTKNWKNQIINSNTFEEVLLGNNSLVNSGF